MQHSVQKQGEFRYNNWRQRQLVTHDTEPYIYMQRKTHPDSKKMCIEEVVLWPHYDKYLITESMSSSAAARTVVLRGRLFPLTFDDLEFLAEVRNKERLRETTRKSPPRMGQAAAEMSAAASRKLSTPAVGRSLESAHLSDGPAGPSSYDSEDDDSDDDDDDTNCSVDSFLPRPAGLNYMNPLLAVPSLRISPKRGGATSSATSRGTYADMELVDSLCTRVNTEDDGEENAGERPDAHGTVGMGRPTTNARKWVVRCPSMDVLRTLIHSLQGINDYRAKSAAEFGSPVPPGCFQGSFEEVEEKLRHVKQ